MSQCPDIREYAASMLPAVDVIVGLPSGPRAQSQSRLGFLLGAPGLSTFTTRCPGEGPTGDSCGAVSVMTHCRQ